MGQCSTAEQSEFRSPPHTGQAGNGHRSLSLISIVDEETGGVYGLTHVGGRPLICHGYPEPK